MQFVREVTKLCRAHALSPTASILLQAAHVAAKCNTPHSPQLCDEHWNYLYIQLCACSPSSSSSSLKSSST